MKLLINEPPLQVLPTLAVRVGLNEAIVLQQVHWLCGSRHAVEHAGHSWFRASYEMLGEVFPFFSERTLQRIVSGLIESGYLVTTTECNPTPMDKTRAYRVNYERLADLEKEPGSPSGQFGHMHQPSRQIAGMQDAKLATWAGVSDDANLATSSLSKRTDSKRSTRSDEGTDLAHSSRDEDRLAEECREAIWIYAGGDRIPWMQALIEFCQGLIRRGTVIPEGTIEQAARLGLDQWRREHPSEDWPRWNTLLTQHLTNMLTPEAPPEPPKPTPTPQPRRLSHIDLEAGLTSKDIIPLIAQAVTTTHTHLLPELRALATAGNTNAQEAVRQAKLLASRSHS